MSTGYIPKNEQTLGQALKVQELAVSGLDTQLYSSVAAPTLTITANSAANPTVVTTSTPHGLVSGQTVTITGSNSTPSINGTRIVTVIDATNFSVAVNVTVAGTAGSVNTGILTILVREPVGRIYNAFCKLDASNTVQEFDQAEMAIVDSNGGLSGYNEFGVAVSDQGGIQITGIVTLNPNDVVVVKYSVLGHL